MSSMWQVQNCHEQIYCTMDDDSSYCVVMGIMTASIILASCITAHTDSPVHTIVHI